MNIRGTALLVLALVFTVAGTIITQSLGTPGMIGLFYGILPKKEFKVLFLVGLISLGWGLINMQSFLSNTYGSVNFQGISTYIEGATNNQKLINTTYSKIIDNNQKLGNTSLPRIINNNQNLNNEFTSEGIISGFINLPQNLKKMFPIQIDFVGEFIGAGLYSTVLLFMIILAGVGLAWGLFFSLIYISNYSIIRILLFPYLPSTPMLSSGIYPYEFSTIMASSGCTMYLIYYFLTIVITHWIFKRIGLYKRVSSIGWMQRSL